MKAALCTAYGPPEVLKITDVPKPEPKDNELLIKIKSTSVSSGDARIRGLNVGFGFKTLVRLMFGFRKPKNPILGMNYSGVVEQIGKNVTKFNIGDEVFGVPKKGQGTYTEYIIRQEDSYVHKKPSLISFDEATCALFGGFTAISYLRDKGKMQSGQDLLINGASGAVGTAAIQIGKYFGARVTGVCSTKNIELVKSLGADDVIDYTIEDFTKRDAKYDFILETVGNLSFSKCRKVMKENGYFLAVATSIWQNYWVLHTKFFGSRKFTGGIASGSEEDLALLAQLLESGKFKPVIDRTYTLDEIVEAHRYVDTGHKIGNVAIKVT